MKDQVVIAEVASNHMFIILDRPMDLKENCRLFNLKPHLIYFEGLNFQIDPSFLGLFFVFCLFFLFVSDSEATEFGH